MSLTTFSCLQIQADDLWGSKARSSAGVSQSAIRWYASELRREGEGGEPLRTAPASHRRSSDISVDQAIGRAIEKHKSAEFALLSDEERRMLFWNLKNVEYALGANVADLSMKFWDIDERHAFEGDHVILKQGYSTVVEHLASVLARYGDRFKVESDFPVGKLEYARQTATQSYFSSSSRHQHLVELSDTCRVTSENGKRSFFCDFVVCAVPLGVLKESIENGESGKDKLNFFPQLPFSKRDAIGAVGFGLLNKVYLQFPFPFWRGTSTMREGQTLFGNASGINPHHYMFFDIGKGITGSDSAPAILMSLISGKEAVKSESIPETQVVAEAVSTLRSLFAKDEVPYPTTFKVTRWGMDRFSRGSYTYLPPGTTDQDFQLLQSPVNGHGDSLLLEGSSEIMRLFFAGEHTTALHPSMAHGALLSGIRAAKEVVRSMSFAFFDDEHIDRVIPIALYRHLNPKRSLECAFCLREGTSVREGTLIAFKRGSRELLAHNNCAENCPEVEVAEGRWKDVIKACNRSKSIECCICKTAGAAIGCVDANCSRSFHFSCAEDTGWRFELDGKVRNEWMTICIDCTFWISIVLRCLWTACRALNAIYIARRTDTTPIEYLWIITYQNNSPMRRLLAPFVAWKKILKMQGHCSHSNKDYEVMLYTSTVPGTPQLLILHPTQCQDSKKNSVMSLKLSTVRESASNAV
jgi:hypothetical protein